MASPTLRRSVFSRSTDLIIEGRMASAERLPYGERSNYCDNPRGFLYCCEWGPSRIARIVSASQLNIELDPRFVLDAHLASGDLHRLHAEVSLEHDARFVCNGR